MSFAYKYNTHKDQNCIQNKNKNSGFTLFELLATITIIGILLSIGIPSYKKYKIKAQVMQMISAAEPIKMAMNEYYFENADYPKQLSELAQIAEIKQSAIKNNLLILKRHPSITGMSLDKDGSLLILSTEKKLGISGNNKREVVLSLTPTTNNLNMAHWTCSAPGATIPNKYLPKMCQKHVYP